MKKLLPFIAFLSGVSGLSYELLYARLISYYFGDVSFVIFTVLITVFVGLALGYIYSYKFSKYLWLIEILLGVYALFIASVFYFLKIDALSFVPHFLLNPQGLLGLSFIVILIPMFLAGFSVPILATYADEAKLCFFSLKEGSERTFCSAFPSIYGLYSIGSALFLILLELVFLRAIGIIACLLIASLLNMIIAAYLYFTQKKAKLSIKKVPIQFHVVPFVLGLLSMMFQFYFIETAIEIYGGTVSIFAFVLAAALLGITLGSYITIKTNLKFEKFLIKYGLVAILPFLLLRQNIYLWAEFSSRMQAFMTYSGWFQVIFILSISLMMFSLFGAVVPLLLKDNKNFLPRDVLFSNSFGNACGIFLAGCLFYPILDLKYTLVIILISISIITLKGLTLKSFISWQSIAFQKQNLIAIFLSIVCLVFYWPHKELDAGVEQIIHQNARVFKSYVDSMHNIYRIRSFGNETILYDIGRSEMDKNNTLKKDISTKEDISTKDASLKDYDFPEQTILNHSSYVPLRFSKNNKTKRRETLFGILPSLYLKHHDKALVLGLGSGVTVSAVADIYKSVKVFEINSTMKKISNILRDKNRDLHLKNNVEVTIQDGFIGTYLEEDNTYDFITLSVSSLIFYSASKLYSKEFFEIAKKKLKKEGVFSIWYDSYYSFSNIDALYNTALSVFEECKTFILSVYYHTLICGEKLKHHPYTSLNIENKFIKKVLSFTPYLNIDVRRYFGNKKYSKKTNTLDKLLTNQGGHFYHGGGEVTFDFDPFMELVNIELQRSSENDLFKICETLLYFGGHWKCEEMQEENKRFDYPAF